MAEQQKIIATAFDNIIGLMDKLTNDWELRAARGECTWICADCCCSFTDGMPDACVHGHQSCTDIIKLNKTNAVQDSV